jgi:transcriptional regulator with XRE-family HTH domain
MFHMRKRSGRGEVLKRLLGQNIKRFRGNSGYSQEELAERAGISIPFLGAIERGDKWPSPSTLAEIARGLGVYPYNLKKQKKIVSQDIRRITAKLTRDITKLVDNSIKQMNTVVRDQE